MPSCLDQCSHPTGMVAMTPLSMSKPDINTYTPRFSPPITWLADVTKLTKFSTKILTCRHCQRLSIFTGPKEIYCFSANLEISNNNTDYFFYSHSLMTDIFSIDCTKNGNLKGSQTGIVINALSSQIYCLCLKK